MNARVFSVAAALSLVGSLAGCTKDEGHEPAAPLPAVGISALTTSVVANGANTVAISVTDTGGGPIAVTTTRGNFAGGGKSANIAASSGALTLVTCDASVDSNCAGIATVTASSTSGTASTEITFGTLSSVCPNNCSADPGCATRTCNLAAGGQGTCSSTVPSTCVSLGSSCTPSGTTETNCSDGLDNDCDGRADCNDSDCQARGGALGKVCDSVLSLTCSAPDSSGNASCTYCPGQQASETTCGDHSDNDCDGHVDCEDTDCTDDVCAAAGRTCDGTTRLCSCPSGLTSEATCDDDLDNDCDGLADCEDPDCQIAGGQACGPFGLACTSEGTCACRGTRENCAAPGDEDCNGVSDCADEACRPVGNAFGAVCDASGHTCSPPTVGADVSTCTICPGGQQASGETSCFDGIDNDCDGRTDCQDPNCTSHFCSATGHTCDAQLMCSCAGGQAAEASCNDGQDNDCDGKVDCADSNCTGQACGANGLACTAGACACSGNGGAPQAAETACADGADNDCDGFSDCSDTGCQPRGNALGAVCNANGMTCSVNLGTGSSCSVCSGNGGRPEPSEDSCGDGFDNDCDGLVDCQDPDCAGLACNSAGKTCTAATRLCACNSAEAGGETTCNDGQDNDCDGKIDCADEDCANDACGSNGLTCAGSSCACSGNGGVAEVSETRCGDGRDNDCDGAIDCADPACRPATGQTYGLSCDTLGRSGMRCNASATCVCSGNGGVPEATESSCGDGFDNDCDGLADCLDPDCRPAGGLAGKACDTHGNTCSGTGTCTVCSGNGGTPEVAETSCGDSRDNDCDGRSDCDDDQCASKACNPLNAAQFCLPAGTPPVSTCTDVTSMYSVQVAATRTRIPADGVNTSDVTATFAKNGVAVPGASCTFGPAAQFPSPNARSTNAAGQATLRFTSSAAGGTATVTVTCTDGVATVAGTLAIDQPLLGLVRLQNQEFSVMGARGSGFQETSTLTFELLDSMGEPYPDGLGVAFRHESQGDSFIGAFSNCTAAVPSVCTAAGATDATGKVQVLLTSGRKFSLLAVQATATGGGNLRTANAGNIAVVGAKASGARLALDCELDNYPALMDHDCTTSFVPGELTCTAALADRHGIVLGVPTVVAFKSEAGAAGVPGVTRNYDGTPSGNAALGYASTGIAVYGHALPADVAPFAGEYSFDYVDGCGLRTHNPRDGISTVIAMANGEEGFVDLDSDGEYDVGVEPFIDEGEPYVDANDNGRWDPDEWFEDVNRDGLYNGPNGVWDANTVIWTQTRVVYTGLPLLLTDPVSGDDLGTRWFDVGLPPGPTTPPTYVVHVGPPTTSQVFNVFFTDENFNPLTSMATYDQRSLTSTVNATWFIEPNQLDELGASYRLLYCDDPVAPTVCAGGTPEQACTTIPCYVVPDVGLCSGGSCAGFGYGTFGAVMLSAGTDTGGGAVGASATILNVKTSAFITGVTLP